jgi:hypothetical protein
MGDYHLETFVTDKDYNTSPPDWGGGEEQKGINVKKRKERTPLSKREMVRDGLSKGEDSEFVAGNEHGGSRKVYFAQKAQKQNTMQSDHILESEIFKGCLIFLNSITEMQEARRLIEKHGGRVVFGRDTETITHYMTPLLTDGQRRLEASKRHKDKHLVRYVLCVFCCYFFFSCS